MSIKSLVIKYRTFFLLILFTALTSYFLINLPLFKEFSYEFAIINGLLFFITIPILVFYSNKKELANKKFLLIILLPTPLIVVSFNYFFFEICSFKEGVYFYLVISLASGLIAFFIAEIIYFLSPRRAYLLLIISLMVLIAIPLFELYLYPQIYFYSPLIGFFPGSIYDEDISIDLKLIIYRALNLLFVYVFYFLIKKKIVENKLLFSSLTLVGIIISFFISLLFGFSTNENRLENLLSNKIETDNFIIYFDKLDSTEQKIISLYFNYYYSELQKSIKTKPSKKIKAFLFENDNDKRKYFGSENADVAKPWLYQIYLDKNSWKSTLKHELAHIFSAEFGSSFLKLSGDFSPFLIEGFATAMDPFVDIYNIDHLAAIHYNNSKKNIIPKISGSINFFGFNSTLSYIFSGSFCKYLIEVYGIDKFKIFYSNNDFEKVYNKKLSNVTDEYLKYLESISIDTSSNTFYYYFGRKALIQKDCPRFIGRKIKEGWKLFEKDHIADAKNVFVQVLNYSDNYSALVGLTECLIKQDSLINAEKIISNNLQKYSKTPYEYLLKFRLADIYGLSENYDNALELYSILERDKPNFNLNSLSNFRIKLISVGLLKDYLLSSDSMKFKIILKLNEEQYSYSSIPVLITLAKNLRIDYKEFLSVFDKPFVQFDEYSFFAFLKLSQFISDNFDFARARKMAALAKRLNTNDFANEYIESNYKMIEWIYFNHNNFN